jgi:hypothetical protein
MRSEREPVVQQRDAIDTDTFRRYLQDQLAGAAVGHAIATRLAETHSGTPVGTFMAQLAENIGDEQAIVETAIEQLPAKPDLIRRATKLAGGTARAVVGALPLLPEPSLLEDLEALAVGVWGKRLLWGALRRADLPEGRFQSIDFEHLSEEAEDQEREILRLREELLMAAFPSSTE